MASFSGDGKTLQQQIIVMEWGIRMNSQQWVKQHKNKIKLEKKIFARARFPWNNRLSQKKTTDIEEPIYTMQHVDQT